MNKKYAAPSRKMLNALADEGLIIHWPKSVKSRGNLFIYGNYSTGGTYDKTVFLDLRDEQYDLSTKNGTDKAIALRLREANKDFEVAKKKLERFDKVARSVATGKPITSFEDNRVVEITLPQAKKIASLMRKDSEYMSWEEFETLKGLADMLENKIAEVEG